MREFRPQVLSDTLIAEYVLKKEDNERFKLDPGWNLAQDFNDYVVLYKIALVLIALLNAENKNPDYLQVHLIFEKAVFTYGNIQKLYFYYQVKSAVDKIGELIDTNNYKLDSLEDQNRKIPCTMACLRERGVLDNDTAIMHSKSSVIGMGWAMAWLRDAGIIETNPVTLTEFALMWVDNYLAINSFLEECTPIV
jgi:hypothetical protein